MNTISAVEEIPQVHLRYDEKFDWSSDNLCLYLNTKSFAGKEKNINGYEFPEEKNPEIL